MTMTEKVSKFSFMCLLCKEHTYLEDENSYHEFLLAREPVITETDQDGHKKGFCNRCTASLSTLFEKSEIDKKILNLHQLVIDHARGVQNVYDQFNKYKIILDTIGVSNVNDILEKFSLITSKDLKDNIELYKNEFYYPAQHYAFLLEEIAGFNESLGETMSRFKSILREYKKVSKVE